jgi:tetrahydromethanopterin S-methyltransferase subunit F
MDNTVTVLRKVIKRKVIKPQVDAIKPQVDSIKPQVDSIKPQVDSIKPQVDEDKVQAQPLTTTQVQIEEKEKKEVKPSLSKDQLIPLYIEQMSPQEKIVLKIAREHLETSFCIEKSLGFLEWHKKYLSMMSS